MGGVRPSLLRPCASEKASQAKKICSLEEEQKRLSPTELSKFRSWNFNIYTTHTFNMSQGCRELVCYGLMRMLAKATVPVWTCRPMKPESGSSLFFRPRNFSLGSDGSAVNCVDGWPLSSTVYVRP